MAVFTFTKVNAAPVAIPDATGNPSVSSLITQSFNVFVSGTITDVNFTVTNLTHTWANDLDLALFAPDATNNLILMSDVGGSSDFSNTTLTFDDAGSSSFLNDNTSIGSGNYLPTNHFVSTGGGNVNPNETGAQFGFPAVTLNNPGPTGGATLGTAFNGTNASGLWTFAVSDDGSADTGSFGDWLLQLATDSTVTNIAGTAGADNLTLASTSATAGSIFFNGTTAEYSGLDTIYFTTGGGLDNVVGGEVSENIIESDALDGDSFNGGAGYDTIDYSNVSFLGAGYALVNFSLEFGFATSDTLASETIIGFENLIASDTDDSVYGTSVANMLRGEAGHDVLVGNDGDDLLYGGVGNDSLYGGNFRDEFFGGLGNDVFRLDQEADNVAGEVLDGGDDVDTIFMSSFGNYVHNLRDDSLISIEALTLDTDSGSTGEVRILATQIDGIALAANLHVTGSADPNVSDRLVIDMTGDYGLDLSNFVMTEFGGPDDRVVVLASSGGAVTISGTGGADEIHGSVSSSFDALYGGGGNDSLYGEAGDDDLYGGLGADACFGGSGDEDWAHYNSETENLVINLANSALNSGAAAVGDTYDSVEGLIGGSGSDEITGNSIANNLDGRGGDDMVYGGNGTDTLRGGQGNDVLFGGAGADSLDGDDGTRDLASYSGAATGLRADLQVAAFNTGDALGDTYSGVEDLTGTGFGDTLLGDTGANIIYGDAGNDIYLDGRIGNDTIYGGAGNDVMIGGAGADSLVGDAGTRDRVQYTDSTIGLRVDLQVSSTNTGIAAGDTYSGIEDIYGSFSADSLLGDTGANIIYGDAGNDPFLDGRLGNDTIYGGSGNDVLIGGQGADLLDGGAGTRDRVQYTESAGVRADLQVSATNSGNAAGDTYAGVEDIYGSFQTDSLLGDGGGNIIWGASGNDVIDGRAGSDTIYGGAGNDAISGGSGADVFVFDAALGATNVDTLTGYTIADDIIHLENAIFSTLAAGALGAAFTNGAAATLAGHRIIYNSATGALLYDADGNAAGAAVQFATLSAGLAMASTEFLVI